MENVKNFYDLSDKDTARQENPAVSGQKYEGKDAGDVSVAERRDMFMGRVWTLPRLT
ncbi:MAG: hypothetical protein FWB94_08295 [Chitinispirillia bacterium]|nr:hypothetical protein [Chitinispirillia bacterium]